MHLFIKPFKLNIFLVLYVTFDNVVYIVCDYNVLGFAVPYFFKSRRHAGSLVRELKADGKGQHGTYKVVKYDTTL